MQRIILLLLIFCATSFRQIEPTDGLCNIRNTSFKEGESLTLSVYYAVAGIYVKAGTAIVNTSLTTLNDKPVYHITAIGTTNSSYNWIFKVEDRYESYIDTSTMQPAKFVRRVHEGSYKRNEDIAFNRTTNTAVTNKGVYKMPECVQDVISAVFNARSLDYSKYKINEQIPFKMFLSNELYNLYIRYMGKETVKTRYGTFNAIKLKPLLIKGEMFKGGEKMTLWISDDPNHIPLRVESPIAVGSIKVDLTDYRNLRYPLSSRIK
ncbi:MAG: DUF3108 domain-containing protein [Arachidicoccus sp.]|nr:DUF3108 domain-containing protein [Arachidicoccus sp.]